MTVFKNAYLIITTNDPDYQELLDEALKRNDFIGTFEFVRNGVRLLDKLYSSVVLPALVVLDITYDDNEVFEVLKQIKEDPLLKSIPIILTTLLIDNERQRCKALGGTELIQQPNSLKNDDVFVHHLMSYIDKSSID